jgi:DNA invertase Pin-like site-specific DNA recombinase
MSRFNFNWTPRRRRYAEEETAKGTPAAEIGRAIGCSGGTVINYLDKPRTKEERDALR